MNRLPKSFETKVFLFQEEYAVTFVLYEEQTRVPYYSAFFNVSDLNPDCHVILSAPITKDLTLENDTINKNGFEIFKKVDLIMSSNPNPTEDNAAIHFRLSKDDRKQDPANKHDFRNWPKDYFEVNWSCLNHKSHDNSVVIQNGMRIHFIESLNWSQYIVPKKELMKIVRILIKTLSNQYGKSKNSEDLIVEEDFYWEAKNPKNGCVPKDIPIKDLAMFCLASGRFPMRSEVSRMRKLLGIISPEKERVRD